MTKSNNRSWIAIKC